MDVGTEQNYLGWLNPNVLTDFIDDLRDAGYKIGISQYIAAHDLILALTAQGETLNRPERLKTLLGPIFCSSPTEQEDFQQRFDRWVEFVSQPGRATETADVKAQALSEELEKIQWRFRQLILTLIAIILTGIFVPILWEDSIKDDSSQVTKPSATQSSATQSSATQSCATKPSATKPSATKPSATKPSATQPNQDFLLYWQISLSFFLLTLCIAFLVWRLWWLHRAHLFLQRHGTTEEPELHKISIPDFEQNLFPTNRFISAAQSLKHRIRIPSHELDVDKTIDATLRQRGWLTPVYDTRQVLPEYLFLINRASYQDHQARFMEQMVDRLRHNGVFITIYFFDNDPRICFPSDGTSSPRQLNEITAKYTKYRLAIVSDTEKLFSIQTGELEPWVSQMTTWSDRAILTPKPVENWGYQELELARQFIVLPATPLGVWMLSQVLHQGSATYVLSEKAQIPLPEMLRIRPHYWVERNPPTLEQINAMLNSLQEYLGEDGFYWLSACAVFPKLHWNITIYLGNVLKTADGHCLLEMCSLTNLARLPWFRYGYMPDWLRSLLIATLTYEQKHTIRTGLQDLLITAVQGTVSRLQLEVAQKHHRFLPKLANSILLLLSTRATEDSPLRDYLFLNFITGRPKLAIEVPDTFSRLLLQKQKRLNWLIGIGIIVTITTTIFFVNYHLYEPIQPINFTVSPSNIDYAIKPTFDAAANFSDGLARVRIDGRTGYINNQGKVVIQPLFDASLDFSDGLALAWISGQNRGYINKTGRFVIAPQFGRKAANKFSEGLASVCIVSTCGYIDKTGKFTIERKFTGAGNFSEGLAPIKTGGKWGYIDTSGNIVIKPQFNEAYQFSQGLAVVKTGDNWNYIDKCGNVILRPQFDDVSTFSEGLAAVKTEGKVGYIDKSGKVVIKPQFVDTPDNDISSLSICDIVNVSSFFGGGIVCKHLEKRYNFSEGLAAVQANGKWGYIDISGNFVIPPTFEQCGKFSDGLALVCLNGKCGYIRHPFKQ